MKTHIAKGTFVNKALCGRITEVVNMAWLSRVHDYNKHYGNKVDWCLICKRLYNANWALPIKGKGKLK